VKKKALKLFYQTIRKSQINKLDSNLINILGIKLQVLSVKIPRQVLSVLYAKTIIMKKQQYSVGHASVNAFVYAVLRILKESTETIKYLESKAGVKTYKIGLKPLSTIYH
jgi:hypothetical protein